MLTASILGFAVLEVDKLFANAICENGAIRQKFDPQQQLIEF